MGESRKLIAGCLTALAVALCSAGTAAGSVAPPSNPWLLPEFSVYNMAHQGGELEAPSSTMYAFRTALEDRGADSLEMDVNVTSDDRLVVMHDYHLGRITPSTDQVRDHTLAEVQALDAAWWFSPGSGQFDHSKPADQYPFRGVRTGDPAPPKSFIPNDFRVPSIEEVLAGFPDTPLNIEIKTVPGAGNAGEAIRVASLLAEVLNRPENRNRPIIVASLDQAAIEKFHELAPDVDVSASLTSMLGLIADGTPVEPAPVALQVPNYIGDLYPPNLLQEMDVASMGYAVHAWTVDRGDENETTYAQLIDAGVQGIITSAPSRLDDYLCQSGIRRPYNSPRCDSQIFKPRLGWPSRSLRQYLKEGLPVRVSCEQPCYASLEVRISKAEAKRLGIKGPSRPLDRGLVIIGTQRPSRGSPGVEPGTVTYRANTTRQPFGRLALARKVTVEITVNVFDQYGWRQKIERRWLTLKSKRPLKRNR